MAEVVRLSEVQPIRAVVPEIVAHLKEWLDRAERGELRAIAFVGIEPGGTIATVWERGDLGSHLHELVAGTMYMQHRLVSSATEDCEGR